MRMLMPLVAGSVALGGASAFAAEAPKTAQLEELVVTAQKREQNLIDVPLSVSVMSATKLESFRATSPEDLTQLTAGLYFTSYSGSATAFVRGVGNPSTLIGDEGTVGIYVDDVYMASKYSGAGPLNGVDHIEVLKGPQGTLFGRNTTGGVISIVTPEPTAKFSGRASVGYGNYDTTTVSAYVTGQIAPNLNANISYGSQQQNEGYFRNLTTGNKAGVDSFRTVRVKFDFRPNDILDLKLGVDWSTWSDDRNGLLRGTYPGTIPAPAAQKGALFTTSRDATYSPLDPYSKGQAFGVSFRAYADLGFADLVSISAYRNGKVAQQASTDMTSVDGIPPLTLSYTTDQKDPYFVSQEVRLVSKSNEKIDWIVGAFYQNSKGGVKPLLIKFNVKSPVVAGFYNSLETKAAAVFGQTTIHLTNQFSMVGGLRYSDEEKIVNYNDLFSKAFPPIQNRSASWDNLSYKLGLNYKPDADTLVYLSYTTGFKAGTFNTSVANPALVLPVNPEKIKAWELGARRTGSNYTLSAALFHYQYSDLQFFARDALTGFGILKNAAAAKIYGAELEGSYQPIQGLRIDANVSYVHGKYTSFPGAPVFVPNPPNVGGNTQVIVDASGQQMVRSPEWTADLNVSYEIPLARGGSAGASSNLYYSSSVTFDPIGRVKAGAYTTVSGEIFWNLPGDRWRLSVWGKNLTDESYINYVSPAAIGDPTTYNDPRTFGATIQYRW